MAESISKPSTPIAEFTAVSIGDPRPSLLLEPSSLVLASNPAAARLSAALRPGATLFEIAAEDRDAIRAYLRRCTQTTGPVLGTVRLGSSAYRSDGGRLSIGRSPLIVIRLREQQEANATFHRLNARIDALHAELGQRRRSEAQLKALLEEKQLLLAEVNHRVKNNLAVMLSMTSLAARGEVDPRVRQKFADLHSRMSAIGMVHSLLYGAVAAADVVVQQLLEQLTDGIARGFNREDIAIRVKASDMRCPPDMAVSLALIVNELVTNAYKHAFQETGRGHIDVVLSAADSGGWRLSVSDDGAGVVDKKRGSGLAIVEAIAAQLKGRLEVTAGPPKRFAVVFNLAG